MDTSGIRFETVFGSEVRPYVPDLASLRIEVFREYPYLYEGSLDYESDYLLSYAKSARSVFALAFDGEAVVGVSTGLPLAEADGDFAEPFLKNGYEMERIFYFGESVLRRGYRGRGIGSRFMRERERHARSLGDFDSCAFCAVQRAADDPRRPAGYQDLSGFWRKYGFEEQPALETSFSWKEIGESEESPKAMRFWLKRL
ncbi:GNAT family N-acetyltransferase [Pelagicoccus sp. SDUM812005]|uniref:GNAT family N-acetyltransferase n=1 Tax=Pelagicoccus sp. SDUM812005 TaxID=3041257 RepID=UPI00280D35EB|nr:GNAT family N-acetyltransferase [Pelagicoccus sp. SDUM812005]MDQ8183805.1 GNAT family N-acetyltransferase [Pelagicoccus sp. SDUM812005]